jgi:hypothetical protein
MSKHPISPPPGNRPVPTAPRPPSGRPGTRGTSSESRPDPERVPTSPDRLDGATVPVAVVTSRTEAELIVGMLRNNNLKAAVSADDAGGLEPELQMQGVRVLVAPSDEASARRLLAGAADTSRRPVSPAPFSGGPAGSPVPEGANRWP